MKVRIRLVKSDNDSDSKKQNNQIKRQKSNKTKKEWAKTKVTLASKKVRKK